MKTNRTYICL